LLTFDSLNDLVDAIQLNMATTELAGLQALLGRLGLDTEIPKCPETDVLAHPVDIYRSYLANILVTLLECDPRIAYESIQPATEITDGDLTIVVPRLRIKDTKPKELAAELGIRVCLPLWDLSSIPESLNYQSK
jgi:arginyl-tRNA synthetase